MTPSLSLAFLKQGRADYELCQHLQATSQARCHWLHALQMACEKTAKAYHAAAGSTLDELKESHLVFSAYLDKLKRNRAIRMLLPQEWQRADQYYWQQLRPIASAIERLVPGRHNTGENAEYPWEDAGRSIHIPLEHPFSEIIRQLNNAPGRNLIKLLNQSIYDRKWAAVFGIALPSDWDPAP